MITYVKAGNSFIWGKPIKGLQIVERKGIRIQHDGDELGVRELLNNLMLNPNRNFFLLALRPVRGEVMKALSFGPDPEIPAFKRRNPPFKFRFFGSPEEAYAAFLKGDYRYILWKYNERNYKHRLAYVKAFIMASQNPFLQPSEEETMKFLDYLRSINDSLLQEYFEELWAFTRGSGTLSRIHNFVANHKSEILKAIKDEESAALWAYELGDPEVAREFMKYTSGVWYHLGEATLAIYGDYGSIADGIAMMTSSDPDEAIIGFLIVTERLDEKDPDERREFLHNLHTAMSSRLNIIRNENVRLPSHVVRFPILAKQDLIIQYVRTVKEAIDDLIRAMDTFAIYADATPLEIRCHIAHDLTLPYLFVKEDPARVIRTYKLLSQAAMSPPDRVLMVPLFVAAVSYEADLKYPMERLLINAKEREMLYDAALALRKALEVNSGPVREILEERHNEVRSSLEMVLEPVEMM